uniref:Uncharacterized protein n=1 Tax=Panagrolaimus sp. ES5 TaxID=591445 RepID=A0AC34GUC1_9BILA
MYDKYLQYSRTKLMNHMITFSLHRLLLQHGLNFCVTANVVDAEEPAENHHDVTCLSASRSYLCSRGNGVHTIQRLAEAPELSHVSGKYFDCTGKEIRSKTDACDERAQKKLWETNEKILEKIDAPISSSASSRGSSGSGGDLLPILHLGSLESARKHQQQQHKIVENNNVEKKFHHHHHHQIA